MERRDFMKGAVALTATSFIPDLVAAAGGQMVSTHPGVAELHSQIFRVIRDKVFLGFNPHALSEVEKIPGVTEVTHEKEDGSYTIYVNTVHGTKFTVAITYTTMNFGDLVA